MTFLRITAPDSTQTPVVAGQLSSAPSVLLLLLDGTVVVSIVSAVLTVPSVTRSACAFVISFNVRKKLSSVASQLLYSSGLQQ